MEQKTEFSAMLAELRAACKKGDFAIICKRAGVSEPTGRKLFTRKYATEITDAEQRVLNVAKDYLKPQIDKGRQIEKSLSDCLQSTEEAS